MKHCDTVHVVLVTHHCDIAGVPDQKLLMELIKKYDRVIHISHPMIIDNRPLPPPFSTIHIYLHGQVIKEIKVPRSLKCRPLMYVFDVYYTVYYFFKLSLRTGIYIGIDNLNAFSGLILRNLRLAQKTIYYTIDYVPNRFQNKLLNFIYRNIEKLACFYSNYIWNLSPLMQQGREDNGLSQERCAPQLVVPVGCDINSSNILPIEKINPYTIAYIGGLTKEVGVYFLIESMSDIVNIFPEAKLIMIGSGAIEPLKELARKFNVEKHIDFLGVIKQDEKAKEILSKCAVGIAFYLDWADNFKKYCEPSKIKFYLSCGLPVITNNMTYFANIIRDRKAGLVVEAEKSAFVNAIRTIFGNKQLLEEMKRNAATLAKEYTWDKIFANAFRDSKI